jgi:hypothetical protein
MSLSRSLRLQEVGEAYCAKLDDILGVYKDATTAIALASEEAARAADLTGVDPEYLRENPWLLLEEDVVYRGFAEGSEGVIHRVPRSEFIERNREGGANWFVLGRLLVAMMYVYWEEVHRERIETVLGYAAQVDVIGELAALRQAVMHRAGIATAAVAANAILPTFPAGQEIKLEPEQFHNIVFAVRRSLLEYLAEDPGPATALASDPPAARRT